MTDEILPKISEADCHKILEKYGKPQAGKVIKHSLISVPQERIVFNVDYYFLNLKIEPANEKQFLIKNFAQTNNETGPQLKFPDKTAMFNKELAFYKFLGGLPKNFPTDFALKFFSALNEPKVLVFEDVTSNGYKIPERFDDQLDHEHIKVALETLAKFHGASLIYEETKSRNSGRKYRLTEDFGAKCLEESFFIKKDEDHLGYDFAKCGVKGLQALVSLLPEVNLSAQEFRTKLDNLFVQTLDDLKPSEDFRNVWSQGDLSSRNLMFKYENTKPIKGLVFNFQLQRYCPPIIDVLLLIYQSTDEEMRQKYLHHFLNHYFKSLTEELSKFELDIEQILSRDEFENSVVKFVHAVKLMKAVHKLHSAINAENWLKFCDNYETYGFKDGSEFLTHVFNTQQSYREIMSAVFQELEDVFTHERIWVEDCYKIVEKKLGTTHYKLLDYKTVPLDEKAGFLGEHCKLKVKLLTADDDKLQEFNFFLKGVPAQEGDREFSVNNDIYFKESKYFTKLVPLYYKNGVESIEGTIPECFLVHLNEVVVFEDYTAKGYTMVNSRTVYDFDMVATVIKKLAKFHGSSFILEEKLSTAHKKFRLNQAFPRELDETFYNGNTDSMKFLTGVSVGVKTHIDLFPDPSSKLSQETFKNRGSAAMFKLMELIKPSGKFRNTVCHGDLWSNNILFKFDGEKPIDCVFVDFQIIRYNPPAHDIMAFLYFVTDRKFRAQHTQAVLDLYHRELAKLLESYGIDVDDVLKYEDFLESCEVMKEFAIIQGVGYAELTQLSSEQIKELLSDEEGGQQFFYEDRGPYIARVCAADSVYREKLKESIINFREICENYHDVN